MKDNGHGTLFTKQTQFKWQTGCKLSGRLGPALAK
jgi:hypothetical protein